MGAVRIDSGQVQGIGSKGGGGPRIHGGSGAGAGAHTGDHGGALDLA